MLSEPKRMVISKIRLRSTKKPPPSSLKWEDFSKMKWNKDHSCKRKAPTPSPVKPSPWFRSLCKTVWELPTNSSSRRASPVSSRYSPVSPTRLNSSPTVDNSEGILWIEIILI
jgi:hypothetical protein